MANRYLVAGSLVLGLPALIFTWSRSSYLAFALGSFLVFWQRKAMRIFLVMMLIVIVVIILLPKPKGEGGNLSRQSTTTARIANWSKSFELFTRQPIFGYGFNTMRYLNLKTGFILPAEFSLNHSAGGLDNSFLFVLATTGVVGFLSYLWLLQTMVKMGLKALKKSRQIGLAFVATFLSLVFHSFFQNSLFYPFNLIWMWLLLASVRKDSGQARMT
ncbi:O-antigen ligase family protein [Candidatus Gottesmanbacteria bacterium]|nr:O-antigen ligase family protein [Candidatus Gottesmanbacteria bacterium]